MQQLRIDRTRPRNMEHPRMTTTPRDTRRSVLTYLARMKRSTQRQGRPAWKAHRTCSAIAAAVDLTPSQTRAVLLDLGLAGLVVEVQPRGAIREFTYTINPTALEDAS